jgi:sortase A
VETRRFEYTYVLDDDGDDRTVDFSEDWVLASNPYDPGAPPTGRLITLVTCSELFHSDDRQAVFGHLVSKDRKPRP